MCAETNSSLGIVSPFFASHDFAASNPQFVPEACWTTAYTSAAVPSPLASANTCKSIALMVLEMLPDCVGLVLSLGSSSQISFTALQSSQVLSGPMEGAGHRHRGTRASLQGILVMQHPGGHRLKQVIAAFLFWLL